MRCFTALTVDTACYSVDHRVFTAARHILPAAFASTRPSSPHCCLAYIASRIRLYKTVEVFIAASHILPTAFASTRSSRSLLLRGIYCQLHSPLQDHLDLHRSQALAASFSQLSSASVNYRNFSSIEHPMLLISAYLSERKEFVKRESLCWNCLGRHSVQAFRSERRCFTCKGKLHTLLHTQQVNKRLIRQKTKIPLVRVFLRTRIKALLLRLS